MINSYQNSIIAQLLEAITGQINFTGTPTSNIGDILLSILEQTPYDKEPKSVLAELFLKLKDKLEGRAFTPYDKEPKSAIAEILLSILNETEYDKEPNSRIAELLLELKAELESYVELTASGAIANFTTSVVKPLVNLTSYFKATQEAGTPTPQSPKAISGVSAVNVVYCHKNMFDLNYLTASGITIQNGEASGTAEAFHTAFNCNAGGVKGLKFENGKQFALSFKAYTNGANPNGQGIYIGFRYTDNTNDNIVIANNVTAKTAFSVVSNSSKTIQCVQISYVNVNSNIWYLSDIQIEVSSQATSYEAYNGSTTLINLGGTYYGGYVTQDKNGKRELVVTCVKEHISLQGKTYDTANGYDAWLIYLENRSYNAGSSTNKLCSVCNNYKYEGSSANVEHYYIAPQAVVIYLAENTFRNGEFDVVYPLETPFTIALPDGEPITAFNGVNNVYNDSGDTSVTYLAKIEDNLNATAKFRAEVKALKEKAKEEEKEIIKEDPIEEVKEPIKDSGETKKGANKA